MFRRTNAGGGEQDFSLVYIPTTTAGSLSLCDGRMFTYTHSEGEQRSRHEKDHKEAGIMESVA